MATPNFTLYTQDTPNGVKIPIAMEELGLSYERRMIDFSKNEQKESWFTSKINPNGRIPALVDHRRGDFSVFESGAILLYLAEHYDPEHKILSADANERSQAIQWLFFQNSAIGPMQGQAGFFYRMAPEHIPYAINRFQTETKRLYTVLESALADGREYLAGKYSVADISHFGWLAVHQMALGHTFDLQKEFPFTYHYLVRLGQRPALIKGVSFSQRIAPLMENGYQIGQAKGEQMEAERAKQLASK